MVRFPLPVVGVIPMEHAQLLGTALATAAMPTHVCQAASRARRPAAAQTTALATATAENGRLPTSIFQGTRSCPTRSAKQQSAQVRAEVSPRAISWVILEGTGLSIDGTRRSAGRRSKRLDYERDATSSSIHRREASIRLNSRTICTEVL